MADKILLVEDDQDLSELMKLFLENEGYVVTAIHSGMEAMEAAKTEKPILVILDLMLPGVNGIHVCQNIRTYSHIPIIVISAKKSDSDKLISLGMGADDYLTKPFSMVELVARVKSQIRRYTTFTNGVEKEKKQNPIRVFGDLVVNIEEFSVAVKGKELPLTVKEFKLVDYFTNNANKALTKEQIMESVWGTNEFLEENTIAVHIGRLREKLAKEGIYCIKTVWGVGYKWDMEQTNLL